jgi:hypothetical protein
MNYFTHIPFGRLLDLAEGRLQADERNKLEAHISSCPRCAAEAGELERLIALMRSDTAEDAPQSVIKQAVILFQRREQPAVSTDSQKIIRASLRFDSLGMAPAFGVRSGEPSARQLLYSAEDHDIDLRIEPAEGGWVLSGQVLGVNIAGGHAKLSGGYDVYDTNFTEQSEFTFPPVPANIYQLHFFFPKLTVEVEGLRIGP